ncbi:MAG TPA: hypothetical protein VHY22_09470 [Chthoniobacteraceae bacterium]|jgi:hypothetical protein|nr:hypothetical protein [Chthoniobacteraceae bacterium]
MNVRVSTITAAAMLACVTLDGCQRKLTEQNFACLKPDMSPKEVESILGPPNRQETREMPLQSDAKTLPMVRYIYIQDGKSVTIHFVDGKMIGQTGNFEQ